MKIRILESIASAEWSFVCGQIVDEDHPHFEAALALTAGPNAEPVEARKIETAELPQAKARKR